nr:proline-rich protein 3-like isoform X2 [Ipomoea batatas]
MTTKISLLLALSSLPIFASLSHGSHAPTSNPATAATTGAVSTADYYDYPPPWSPPEWFYSVFPPQLGDMIRQQVHDMSGWMGGQFQPPYGGGSYPQPQRPPVQQQPTYPAPGECTDVTQVIDTCAQKSVAKSVKDGYSWSCSYNDDCCRAAFSVSDNCMSISPMIRTIKSVCCGQ